MANRECHGITGRLTIILSDGQGNVVEHRRLKNIITNRGKNLVANYFIGSTQAIQELSIAIGSDGDTPADASNTELGELLGEAKAETSAPDNIATVTATFNARGGDEVQGLREAGILIRTSDRAEPILYNRVTFPVINKGPNMAMTLCWEVIF